MPTSAADYIVGILATISENNIFIFYRNIFEWHNPFVSFCALIVIPAVIWNFEIWMISFSLILSLTIQIVKSSDKKCLAEEDETGQIIDKVREVFWGIFCTKQTPAFRL